MRPFFADGGVCVEKLVTNGLVIRQVNYGEADRILHIFTEELGIVNALAKGARKYKSHQGSAAQLLCYGQFTLAPGRGMYRMQGASVLESFFALSQDIEKLALCTYLFDVTAALVQEQMSDRAALSLLLNTLYILANKDRPLALIKAVYELRLLLLEGFGANCGICSKCGKQEELSYFSNSAGGVVCQSCAAPGDIPLSAAALAALRYILDEPLERIFSFSLPEAELQALGKVSEKYLLYHIERSFPSLDYYKQITNQA